MGYLFEIHSKYECREVEIESIETNARGLESVLDYLHNIRISV